MKYNFDEIINRENTDCEKYDGREEIFGNTDIIPLWVADTDFRVPDFITNAIKERVAHEIYGYPKISESYYASIQGWMAKCHNWKIEKEYIQFSPNVVVGLSALVASLTKPGDKIIVQPPVYFPFFNVVKGNGRTLVENPLKLVDGRYCFDMDDLKSKVDAETKMLILCNPHNPGGMVWSKDELIELGNFCIAHNIIVVSDEIHSDLIYSGHKHIPFASISEEFAQNSAVVMSASKTFNVAGLSSAYIIVANKAHRKAVQNFTTSVHLDLGNIFGLVATEAAYANGDNWLDQLIEYLEENLNYVTSYFEENIPKAKVMKPEGTYLLWVDLSGFAIDGRTAYKKITEAGVGLSPGFLFGQGGEDFVRINLGCPRSVLVEVMPKIKAALCGV